MLSFFCSPISVSIARFSPAGKRAVSRVAVDILDITGIIFLSLDQYAVHKHQIDLYHTAFYYHNSLSV